MAKRAYPSTVDKLPKEIREKIGQLRQSGRTLDDIMAVLETLVTEEDLPSRSALGRHVKRIAVVGERLRESRQLAEALAKNFGDKQTSDIARANLELLQDIILKMITDPDTKFDSKDAMFLATAMDKAAKAGKTDFDQQVALAREIERREATAKAAEKATAEAKKRGLSADTVAAIKTAILGID